MRDPVTQRTCIEKSLRGSLRTMGNASSRSQPPGPQGTMQTGAQFASYLSVCSLGDTDAQEYIIYVNDTPFDISAFEAQFGSIYSEKPSLEQRDHIHE